MKSKIKFQIIFFILFSIVSNQLFSQFEPSSWRKIEDNPEFLKTIPEQYEINYKSNFRDSIHVEYKSYNRFIRHWHDRVGILATGELSYEPYLNAVLNNMNNPICDAGDPANWQLMGPTYHPKQQQGLFTEVLYDPDYPEKLLASTNHGGLWKFNPTTEKWYSVTDDLRIPGLSANDILRNPFDSDMIFVATGNGQWHTKYGVGLLVSNDRGESWSVNQAYLNHVNNQNPRLIRVLPDPNDNDPADGIDLYVASPTAIYIGYDNGQTWQTITPNPGIVNGQEIMDMELNYNGDILIGTFDKWGNGLGKAYIFSNGQWSEILTETGSIFGKRVKFSTPYKDLISGNDIVFAVKDRKFGTGNADPTKRTLYKSIDGGVTWSMIKESIVSGDTKCEIEYSFESNRIYVPENTGMMVISPSSGNNLYKFESNYDNFHADVRDINIVEMNNGIEKVFVANDGGISEVNFNVNNPNSSIVTNKNGLYLPCNNTIGLAVSNSSEKTWFTSAIHQGTFKFSDDILLSNGPGDGEDGVYNPDDKSIYYTNSWGTINSSVSGTVHYDGYYSNGGFIGMRMEINPNNPNYLYFGLIGKLGIYNEATQQTSYSTTISTNENVLLKAVGPIAVSKDNYIYIAAYKERNNIEPGVFMVSYDDASTWIDKSMKPVWHKVNGQWEEFGSLAALVRWNHISGITCNPENNDELWIAIGRIKEDETFRVLHTTDGGENWYDYSEGLPGFPAIDFLYHYETETLFLGTDVGVFYRHPFNDQNGEWSCFSEGLPVAAITELDINECSNELFVSMQSRSVFSTPIPFPIVNAEYDQLLSGMNITNPGTVWNSSYSFDGDVYIAPGADLTINADCYFSEGNKIVVMPGGQLTVNAKLSNLTCGGPWQGIQVSGNSNQAQHPDYQGLVYLNSGAIIKHAVIGVSTCQFDAQGNEIANSYGGIIKANGAKFINNRIGCEVKEYNYSYNSLIWQTEIKNCEFFTDGNYYSLFDPYVETPRGIEMVNNKRIIIEDNSFLSAKPLLDNWSLYPYGILKYNSQAIITGNVFNGLSYGIYSRDYYPGTFVDEISENEFRSSVFGIYEDGVTGSQIYLNDFNVYLTGNIENTGEKNIIGIYKNSCVNYLLDENDFNGNMIQNESPVIGIIVNDGGSNDQLIYKNDFEGFDYAILAQGTNRNSTGSSGLSFKCNEMFFEHNDIAVSASLGTTVKGIAASQGSGVAGNTQAAGNLFNDFVQGPSVEGHFLNISDLNATVTYHHHNMNGQSNSVKDRIIPGNIDPSLINGVIISENGQSSWDSDLSCPSQLDLGIGGKLEKLENSGDGISSTESTLNLLIDAGDTPEMTNEVQTSQSSEAYELQTDLLNSSPYLSNEVLESATDKEEVLTNPLIRDVLVANPQSAKNEEVLELIDNRVNPMPQYMKDQILSGQALISAKEQMEAELHQHRLDYNYTLSTLISEYSNENGENYSIENLNQMLATAKNIEARYQLVAIKLKEGDMQAMNAVLSSISTDFNLDMDESEELSDITTFYGIINQLKIDGRKESELTSNEINTLTSLYENSQNKASVYARNLLLAAAEIDYEAPVIYPDFGNKSALITTTANSNTGKNNVAHIDVYPNPARDYIIFEYDIAASFDNAHIYIYNSAKGTLVMQKDLTEKQNALTIDTKEWAIGTYLVSILVNGEIVNSTKFNVVNK